MKDIVGLKSGRLTVISLHSGFLYLCKCSCGEYKIINKYNLTRKLRPSLSCGKCIHKKDITGQKFNRLTAIRFSHNVGCSYYWLFRCDCGKEKIIQKGNVISETIKSCGCYRKENQSIQAKKNIKHGLSSTRFYHIWRHISRRCGNKNAREYKDYGGRGIKLLWNKFEDFRDDMYKSYLKHIEEFGEKDTSIDRIDNNGHYSKENCRWATQKEQMLNTRRNRIVEYKGVKKSITLWAEEFNMNRNVIYGRLGLGWSIEKILTTPIKHKNL